MKQKQNIQKFVLSTKSTVAEIYHHFCKARDDERLDMMYEGVKKKLKALDCPEREKTILSNDIYIAYGKRQEDFDGLGKSQEALTTVRIANMQKEHPELSPEDMLRQALQSLE